jgi:PleD family two-component response regulator
MRLQERTGLSGKDSARPYRLSLSMGFVEYDPEKPEGIDDLLARADKLMYVEKSIKKPRKG